MNAGDALGEPRFATELLFTDGLPEMDDDTGYRGAVAARAAGITTVSSTTGPAPNSSSRPSAARAVPARSGL